MLLQGHRAELLAAVFSQRSLSMIPDSWLYYGFSVDTFFLWGFNWFFSFVYPSMMRCEINIIISLLQEKQLKLQLWANAMLSCTKFTSFDWQYFALVQLIFHFINENCENWNKYPCAMVLKNFSFSWWECERSFSTHLPFHLSLLFLFLLITHLSIGSVFASKIIRIFSSPHPPPLQAGISREQWHWSTACRRREEAPRAKATTASWRGVRMPGCPRWGWSCPSRCPQAPLPCSGLCLDLSLSRPL